MRAIMRAVLFFFGIVGVVSGPLPVLKKQPGDACTIGGKGGKWTDIDECPATAEFVQVADEVQPLLKTYDILVCCEASLLPPDCLSDIGVFEFTRFDHPHDASPPWVLMKETCDPLGDSPQKSVAVPVGANCQIDGQEGVWTYDNSYCGQFNGTAIGCCRPPRISKTKCQEYAKFAGDTCSSDEEWHFLAHLFDGGKKEMPDCTGVLISEYYVMVASWCIHYHNPRYVRIGGERLSSYLSVKTKIQHSHYVSAYQHAISLLLLKKAFVFSRTMRPACLTRPMQQKDVSNKAMGIQWYSSDPVVTYYFDMHLGLCRIAWSSALDENSHFCANATANNNWLKFGTPLISQPDTATVCTTTVTGILIGNSNPLRLFARVEENLSWLEEIVWFS